MATENAEECWEAEAKADVKKLLDKYGPELVSDTVRAATKRPRFLEALEDLISQYDDIETYWPIRFYMTEATKKRRSCEDEAESARRQEDNNAILYEIVRLIATPEELDASYKKTISHAYLYPEEIFDKPARNLLWNDTTINQRVSDFIKELAYQHAKIWKCLAK
jgi:hypothetical protein